MFVTPHGARPLARGGAFVAGADDLNGIYYNPAAIASPALAGGAGGWSILADGGLVLQSVTYTREENGIQRPAVSADGGVLFGAPLVIPQLAFSRRFAARPWGTLSAGFGLWIPYTGLPRYPEPSYQSEMDLQAVPDRAPQRYALVGLHDGNIARSTILAVLNPAIGASLFNDKLQVGLGPQLMLVYFRSALMLSGCTNVMCRPEQVDFDTYVVAQAFAMTPSFNLGATYRALSWLQLGVAFQFPFYVRSLVGTVDTRLPTNEFFNGASVKGRDASLSLNLPLSLRAGVEFRALRDKLRVELAYTLEAWSQQEDITFTPQGITIEDVKGVGVYALGPISLQRRMQDTHSIHLGAEFSALRYLTVRAGGMFETNSTPDSTVTVLTPDNHKGLVALGLAVPNVRFLSATWRFDVSYGHVIQPDRVVASADSRVFPANPIRPTADFSAAVGGIGGGLYQVSYDLLAVGISVLR